MSWAPIAFLNGTRWKAKWAGEVYQGSHAPIVSRELWDKVQAGFGDRYLGHRDTVRTAELTCPGLVRCGHCGCLLSAQIHKEKYVYYKLITIRASRASSKPQQRPGVPVEGASCSFMCTPTTSWPASTSRPATVEESTPPVSQVHALFGTAAPPQGPARDTVRHPCRRPRLHPEPHRPGAGARSMSFGIYLVGFLFVIVGIAWGMFAAGIPAMYIGISCTILVGIGILTGVAWMRQKDPPS